jgi:hypothetical protein
MPKTMPSLFVMTGVLERIIYYYLSTCNSGVELAISSAEVNTKEEASSLG